MNEELLKAIVQLFAIVSRERITEEERQNIKGFLALHVNQEQQRHYLTLFDDFCKETNRVSDGEIEKLDEETQQFVDDWSQIMEISKKVNQELTMQQRVVVVMKIIELVFADEQISERQSNLIFYIGEALKIPQKDFRAMRTFVMGEDIEELSSSNILVIDEGSDTYEFPNPRIVARNLTGLIAILRLPDTEVYFIKYLGISSLYLNSLLLKSRKIEIFPAGSTIRGNKVEPIYYSDILGKFLTQGTESEITFATEYLFYHFKSGRAGLQNINLSENGAKLIGIMGASGSGKSTLLTVLNGTEKPSSGRVIINGINIHEEPQKIQGVIGFVPQDDLLMEDLSVFQNLSFAAQLCFGHYSDREITELVDRVLLSLGLSEIRHLRVGSVLQKTISGGQRKRLNIGLELLREPTILFVDEPTSGLSSRDSVNIMDLLKELTLRGKMIFVVIHQPSSDIFKMFDSLLILDTGGFQIYSGNPIESINYFQDIVNVVNKTPGACPECGTINPEQIFNIIETRVVNEYGRFTHTRKISPGQWYQYFKKRIKIPTLQQVSDELKVTQQIPNWFKQLNVFIKRDVLSKLVNKQYMTINLLLTPVLALFISYFAKYYVDSPDGSTGYTFYHNDNIPVYFFMSVIVALFVGLIVSAEEIFRDRKILKREKFLHLSWSSYLTSKVLILFSLSAVQTLCFILVGNWVLEIPYSEIRYWLILFTTSCFANMLGLNISSGFSSAVTIYIIIPILIIPQLLLSGIVIGFDRFNPKVSSPGSIPWMGETMASRWAFEAFMVTQFKDNPFEKQFYDLDRKAANAEYKRTYYLPELETRLSYINVNRNHWGDAGQDKLVKALDLLRSEIGDELNDIGSDHFFPDYKKLSIDSVDENVCLNAAGFLEGLRKYYLTKSKNAQKEKDSLVNALASTPEKEAAFTRSMQMFQNQKVTEWVTNTTGLTKVEEWDGQLLQKIYPIYIEIRPKSFFDFRAGFYTPEKHFAGSYFDTLHFNLSIIWIFTALLYVALYFEWLKKLVDSLEARRKYKKRDNG
ncbi:MAG: ATP-binding cassette domain-containing protein [Flammeovirgaceae bacterium]|nr:ATP-binding cassette domain-containing protein [Flammeovirgaceae bacterium]